MKFELTENHINLIKNLRFKMLDGFITTTDEFSPFGGSDIYEDIDIIINGKPMDSIDPNSLPTEILPETKSGYDKLYSELPDALSIVLMHGHKTGTYKRRSYETFWVPVP